MFTSLVFSQEIISKGTHSSQKSYIAKPKENPAEKTVNHALETQISPVHEKKKTHKCSICDKHYYHKSSLKNHITSVHQGNKSYKCSICDFTSAHRSNLKSHIHQRYN